MPRVVVLNGVEHTFEDDPVTGKPATDAQISAALKAIPSSNAKDSPKAKTWTDTAVDLLPAVGATIGAIGGAPSVVGAGAGGATGAALGAVLKQGINKLRGEPVPETAAETAANVGKEAAVGALSGAGGGLASKAVIPAGKAAVAAGEALQSGSETLRGLLALGHGWKAQLAKMTIPPLSKGAGRLIAAVGRTVAGPEADTVLADRLARIPIAERLAQIGRSSEEAPKIAASVAQDLADDVGLLRESISKGMSYPTAIRILAQGDEKYAELLKRGFAQSVKDLGTPVPEKMSAILKRPSAAPASDSMKALLDLPAFKNLPKP